MEELLKTIQESYGSLPRAKQKFAKYIVEHYKEIPFQNVIGIAEELDVSDTTIIRYCVQLGFNGFSDFKRKITENVQMETLWQDRIASHIDAIRGQDVMSRVCEVEIDNIRETLQNPQNRQSFDRLLDALDAAENIYISGFRSSAILARYLTRALGEQGYRTIALTPESSDYRILSIRITPRDLLISFSFSRYYQEIVDIVNYTTGRGIPHVAFTDTMLSPTARDATACFICTVKSFHNTPSLAASFALIDAILSASAQRHPQRAKQFMKETEEFFGGRDLYGGLS